jgi:uncharacterized protein Smg (DUF494 family)
MESAQQRLKNLLLILLESLATYGDGLALDRRRFHDLAAAAGYDAVDVGGILDWLEGQWLSGSRPWLSAEPVANMGSPSGVRCYGDPDRQALEPAAFGYLLRLVKAGQLSRGQMEQLLQHAGLVAATPLDNRELDVLIDQVVFGRAASGADFAPGTGAARPH